MPKEVIHIWGYYLKNKALLSSSNPWFKGWGITEELCVSKSLNKSCFGFALVIRNPTKHHAKIIISFYL